MPCLMPTLVPNPMCPVQHCAQHEVCQWVSLMVGTRCMVEVYGEHGVGHYAGWVVPRGERSPEPSRYGVSHG